VWGGITSVFQMAAMEGKFCIMKACSVKSTSASFKADVWQQHSKEVEVG